MSSTTQDLAEQLLTSLGGNVNDVQGKYLSSTNDILEACINQVGNGGGGSNSSNIQIPIPQIHIGKTNFFHTRNEDLGFFTNTNLRNDFNEFPPISLFWNGANTDFLQHDPHYFLFKYVKKGQGQGGRKRQFNNSDRKGKTFVHVGQVDRKENEDYTPLQPMFTNFGGGGNSGFNLDETKNFIKIGDTKQTEWAINQTPFALSRLLNFKAKHYYKNKDSGDFFPITDFADNSANVLNSFISLPKVQKQVGVGLSDSPRYNLNLVLKFAIVIRNPLDPTKYILGGFSDSLIIKPTKGYFSDVDLDGNPIPNQMCWYKWSAMIK